MPIRPLKMCNQPGCSEFISGGGYCAAHTKKLNSLRYSQRGSSSKRGYDAVWQKFRDMFLRAHPLCEDCLDKGEVETATDVHHVISLRKGGARLDPSNCRALSHGCHSIRTAKGE